MLLLYDLIFPKSSLLYTGYTRVCRFRALGAVHRD